MGPAAQILTLLVAFGAHAAPVQDPTEAPAPQDRPSERTFAGELAAVQAARVADLVEHAAWCQGARAYAERNQAWEAILELEPDHAEARRAAGFARDRRTQTWVRRSSYRAPRSSPAALAAKAQARLSECNAAHLQRALPLLDAQDPGTSEQRLALLRKLLELHPGHWELLRRKGWVQRERAGQPTWGLPETFRAREVRAKLERLQRELEEAWVEPQDNRGPTRDQPTGIEWPVDYTQGGIQVLASTSPAEAAQLLRTCKLTWSFAARLFDLQEPAEQTLLATSQPPLRRRLLLALANGDQARFERLQRMSGSRKGTRIVIWDETAPARLDAACRQTIALALGRGFGVSSQQGWITEGFGMALCQRLLGTRLTYFVSTGRYEAGTDRAIDAVLRDPDSDWLALAADALAPAQRPNLAFLLGRNVNSLGATDLVVAYALATFLIEGHPPQTTRNILQRIGGAEPPALVLEEELGYDLTALGERLHDWLRARF